MERELILRIHLEKPAAGVDFALQKGKGNDYEPVQTQRSKTADLHFEFTARVKEGKGGVPNFLGPFVQGPPADRFIYLDIGAFAGQKDTCWNRRLKIPLRGITWKMVKEVTDSLGASRSKAALEARVPGTGSDGGPSCGTVKNFSGWKSSRAS